MKSFLLLINIFLFALVSSQELNNIEKTKIGKYKYEIYLKENWSYEENKTCINYILRFKNKKQYIGNYLTYRKTGSSKNYERKISEELPPDSRLLYRDGILLMEGNIEINEIKKEIIIKEKTINKDEGFQNTPDYTIRLYKQRKDGFFDLIKITEYRNETELVIYQK